MINNSVASTSFYIDPKDRLVRVSIPRRGKPYEHRCSRDVYEQVAHWIDERGERPFTGEEIVAGEDAPHSQVFAALAFLDERSIIERRGKMAFAVNPDGGVHLDAMTEWHALRENA